MAVRTISTKLAIDGEAQYKQSISACNSELKTLKSSLALVESEFKGNANSMEALTAKGKVLADIQSAQAAKVSELEKALANAQTHQKAYADAAAEAGQKVSEYSTKLEELKNSTGDTQEEQAALNEELKKWKTAQEEAEAANNAATRGVQDWQRQLNNAKVEQNYLAIAVEENNQYLREAEASADGCATSIDQYGKAVKEAGDASEDFGDRSSDAIDQLAQVLIASGIEKGARELAQALLECSAASEKFESSIAKVVTIADTSVLSIEDIKAQILTLSSDTGKTSTAVAEATYAAISAGVDTANAVDFVAKASKLAAGGFTETETAVDVLTTALNAYKMSANESTKVSDILITTQNLGKTSVDELAKSVGGVIPLAAAYNVQMDNLGTSYAIMTANGTATAEAGTKLKAMLGELGDTGSKVAGVLKEQTGKSFAELTAGGMSLGDVLAVLGDSVGGNATAFNELWSSSEAGVGALSLFNSGAEKFNSVLGEMQNSTGATAAAYETMADTTEFAHQRMTTATENLKIAIGSQLNPALEKLYDTGADAFSWATDFVNEHPVVVKAVAALVVGLTALTAGVTTVTVATAAMNAVMAANPIGLIAAAAVAAVAAIGTFAMAMTSADDDTKDFTKSLKETKTAYDDLSSTMTESQASTSATANSLLTLLAVEERSALQKDLIAEKVAELNEAIPTLGLAYDSATDSINMEADAIERLVEKAAEQEEYEAQVARLSELYTEQAEISARLEEAQAALNEAEEAGVWNTRTLKNNVEELTSAQEENAAQIAELESASAAYAEQQAEAAARTSEMTARIESITAEMDSLQAAYDESQQKARESIESQIGLFDEMDSSAKTSIDNLIETLKGQVAYMETYSENIQKAMEMGVDQGLVKKLSDGSEESAQILDAIVKGGTDDIKALNEQLAKVEEGKKDFSDTVAQMETDFDSKMGELVKDLNDAIQDMDVKNDAYKIGENNIRGLIQGTGDQRKKLVDKYREMGEAALAAYKKAVQQQSPSKAFYQAGSFDIQGIIKGAESEKGNLGMTYDDIARTALASLDKAMRGADLPDYSPEVDYSTLMMETKDLNEFLTLASMRSAKIIGENIDVAADGYATNAQLMEKWKEAVGLSTQDIERMAQSIQYNPEVDYSALMLEAKDLEEFLELASQRTAKILNENIATTTGSYATNAQLLEQWLATAEQSADQFEKSVDKITYQPEVDYSSLMLAAENLEEFEQLAAQRTAKIVGEHIDMVASGYADNAQLLAQWQAQVEQTMAAIDKSVNGVSYDPDVDYSSLMLEAKSLEEFQQLAAQRRAKIVGENIDMIAQGYADNEKLLEQWNSAAKDSGNTLIDAVTEMEKDFSAKMEDLKASMDFAEDAYQTGVSNIRGFIDGAASMQDALVSQYAEMGKAAVSAYAQEVRQINLDAAYTDIANSALENMERFLPSTQLAFQPVGQERQTEAIVSALSKLDFGGGSSPQSGLSAADVAAAMRDALAGTSVQLDGRRVGKIITDWQNNDDRSWDR